MTKLDKRREYYIVLDCETATLPFAQGLKEADKKKIAIAKPLIYDLGWTIIDKKGRVYARKNYLITEIFSVPEIFNTAYYASKRPLYIDKLNKGEIILTDWRTATADLVEDMNATAGVGAYNSMFDYKKALPFTELYINQLYSPNFHDWLDYQNGVCAEILKGNLKSGKSFEADKFRFRGNTYNLFDLWGLSCSYLLDNDDYRTACVRNDWQTESGKYFKTSAETTYRFVTGQNDFDESHTAIDDADIESEIFALIVKKAKNKVPMGIEFFPFRILGTVEAFLERNPQIEDLW